MEIQIVREKRESVLSLNRIENVFFLNGVASILGWNSVLSSLDYFSLAYKNFNVYLYFPIPVFVAYLVSAIIFHWLSNKFRHETLIRAGIIGTNIFLILLLGISFIFKQNTDVGFYLSLACCFLLGFFNNICQLTFYALINYFGGKTVSRFTIGTAASGLILIVLRAIITAIFETNQSIIPLIVYFTLAILLNFLDLYCNYKMFQTPQFLKKTQSQQSLTQTKPLLLQPNSSPEPSYMQSLWISFKLAFPYPLFIFLNIMITFTLFPNLSLSKQTSLGSLWTGITLIFVFNLGTFIGDFLGKIIADWRGSFNQRSIAYLLASRVFFYYTIIAINGSYIQGDILIDNSVFPFVNMLLFALTNGLVTNGSFILVYQKSPPQYKKYAGVLCGILLEIGIIVGTFLAIPLQILANLKS